MSARTSGTEQGVSTDGSTRRVAPAVVQASEAAVAESDLGEIEGHLVVLYGEADSAALEQFDRSLETGEADAFVDLMDDELAAEGESGETVVSADLSYHGETIARDLTLGEADSFGVALVTYNGGELDEMGFKVEETGASLEYRVVAVPPTLDERERDTAAAIPTDLDESMVKVSDGTEMCGGLIAAAAFGYAVGSTLVAASDKLSARSAKLAEGVGSAANDESLAPSFDELAATYE